MKAKSIHIKELRLRATGLTRAEARRMGECVAERLADLSFTVNRSKTISTMSLNVPSNHGASVERIAQAIAQKVKRRVE